MTTPESQGAPNQPPPEWQQRYDELQRRVTRFSVVEQDLINTRDRLDRELERFARIHSFNTRAIQARAENAFATIVAEAIVDVFELEFGVFWLEAEPLRPVAVAGLAFDAAALAALGDWLRREIGGLRSGPPRLFEAEEVPGIAVAAGGSGGVRLRQLIVAACQNTAGHTIGWLAGGITETAASFHDPLALGHIGSFEVFAQQVSALLENRQHQAVIEQQIRQIQISEKAQREARELAEAANRAKSDFLANISHEIRTPMNGVLGMNSLLLNSQLDATQRHYAETIRASGESLLSLINDILDLAKIESGKLEFETLDFDLRQLLEDFAVVAAIRAHEKKLEFICSAAPDVPGQLRGAPGRLRQVLLNLAGNAVKFTRQGEVVVQVTVLSSSDSEVRLRFSVRDTGIGIPQDKQAMLFQKFTQVDASSTRQYGGTGLGLAISREIVQRLGGEIGLNSAAGSGSEFWFTARFARRQPLIPASQASSVLWGRRVLVVDDNATYRDTLAAQLRAWGAEAEAADGAVSALRLLGQAASADRAFEVALIDLDMPGMDGMTLGRVIRANERLKPTRLVMLTQLGQHKEIERILAAGFAACLTKPMRRAELIQSVLAEPPRTAPAPVRPPAGIPPRSGVRILLAEDNVTNQEVAFGLIAKFGHEVDAVANGAEAIAALRRQHYDLVLMDMQMPELDGLAATRQIRSAGSGVPNPSVPIIAMTAHAMAADRDACFAAGMDDYLTKPVSGAAIAAMLEKWLARKPGGNRPPLEPPSAAGSSPSAGNRLPDLDAVALSARVMGDEQLGRELVAGFLGDIPKRLIKLRQHLTETALLSIEHEAHAIKGAAATVSGRAMNAAALELETAARAGDLPTCAARIPKLEASFHRLREALIARYGPCDSAP